MMTARGFGKRGSLTFRPKTEMGTARDFGKRGNFPSQLSTARGFGKRDDMDEDLEYSSDNGVDSK